MVSASKRFVKKVPSSGVAPIYKLSLPHKFVQAHLADAVGSSFEIASASDSQRSWHACIISRRNRDRQEFCLKGWKLFAEAHAVQAGDQFSFELVGDRRLIISLLTRAADGPPPLSAAGHARTRSAAARRSPDDGETDRAPRSPTGSPATVQDSGPDSVSSMEADDSCKLQDDDGNTGSAMTRAALQLQTGLPNSACSMSFQGDAPTMDQQGLDEMPEATMVILLKAVVEHHDSPDRQVPCSPASPLQGPHGKNLMNMGGVMSMGSLRAATSLMNAADLNVLPLYNMPLQPQLPNGAAEVPKPGALGLWGMQGLHHLAGSMTGLQHDPTQACYKRARRAASQPSRLGYDT